MTGQSIPERPASDPEQDRDPRAILLGPDGPRLATDETAFATADPESDLPPPLAQLLPENPPASQSSASQIRPPEARKRYFPPPPQFPAATATRAKLFAATPPLAFQAVFGLLMALVAIKALRPMSGPHDAAIGIGAGLWLFCMIAYATKIIRRRAVLLEDLRVLTGNAGLAAALLSSAALALLLQPLWAGLALVMAGLSLAAQVALAGMAGASYLRQGPRDVTPVWQLNFASFALAGIVMAGAGQIVIAQISFAVSLVAMLVIWGLSLRQMIARIPPEPLRPLLVLHLLPPALLAVLAARLGYGMVSLGFLALCLLLAVAVFASLRWILTSGFTPIWAVMPAPIGAFAWAMQAQVILIGAWIVAGIALIAAVWTGYRILKLWAENKLAAQTNSAVA